MAAAAADVIVPGPADESAQTVTFTVANDDHALFAAEPAVAASGTLSYTPAPGAHGTANVTVQAVDDGDGGVFHPDSSLAEPRTDGNGVGDGIGSTARSAF